MGCQGQDCPSFGQLGSLEERTKPSLTQKEGSSCVVLELSGPMFCRSCAAKMYTVRVKIITGSLVILENVYRYRYRLEIRMNFHYRYRLGVRSHPFISIDSQLPS